MVDRHHIVNQAMEKVKVIQKRLMMAQSRKKFYTNVRRRPLEFEVNDWVYLNVSPKEGVMGFGNKGNLVPGILDLIESPKEWAMCLMSWSYPKS